MKVLYLLVVFALLQSILGDTYMHNPRGSNDRLNEANANRNNDNRLFDSQNNAKGGYCWGEPLTFYAGSLLSIEWTNQHSCGINTVCNIILQYMCDNTDFPQVRDGHTTNTIPDNIGQYNTAYNPTTDNPLGESPFLYGMHEDYWYYQRCKTRQRNQGLFIADRQLGGNTAIFTRQNNNGNRNGFECPEERDYYPYWHPTPWKDIAIITTNTNQCDYFRSESQNKANKGNCSDARYNNKGDCETKGNAWTPVPSWGIEAPDCVGALFNRDNHLGNTITGYTNMYNWTIPQDTCKKAVLRLRYNISTTDYDGWGVDARKNGAKSPVKNNPTYPVNDLPLTLALNTAQYGRTFQDRSHVFAITPRPSDIPSDARIYNLNVRGKRGNIVQAYPAVEYDFTPTRLILRQGDYVHFQWTGCDTNPAGNAGEGRDQTDRSNIVQVRDDGYNLPYNTSDSLFSSDFLKRRFAYVGQELNLTFCYNTTQLNNDKDANGNAIDPNQNIHNCKKLNAAPRYFSQVVQMNDLGVYNYISTRNNNFSNRSQKGVLIVIPLMPVWAIAVVCVGGVAFLGAAAMGAANVYSKKNPDSGLAKYFGKV